MCNDEMCDIAAYSIIVKEECEKYKDWLDKYGYEPLPSNPTLMINRSTGIDMHIVYTNSRRSVQLEGHLNNEFGCYHGTGNTPEELINSIKDNAYIKMVDMRKRLDAAIYLMQR